LNLTKCDGIIFMNCLRNVYDLIPKRF